MKKMFVVLSIGLLLLTGCGNNMNTPTDKVEEFLSRYQNMDSEVLTQLDNVIAEDTEMNDEQKKEYRSLLEKQYQNLSYKIKNEKIDGDKATVDVEIEVYDYAESIQKAKDYYTNHKDEFEKTKETIDEDNNDKENILDNNGSDTTDKNSDTDDENKLEEDLEEIGTFIDYKIEELKKVKNKIKYEITFNLTKKEGKWEVEDISDTDIQKIHGLFEG